MTEDIQPSPSASPSVVPMLQANFPNVEEWDDDVREMGTKGMEEIEVVLKRFGDEQSTLLDRFERLSFEVQLNQAILGRSLSESHAPWHRSPPLRSLQPQSEPKEAHGRRHRYDHRGLGFQKVLKKIFKPIFGNKKLGEIKESIPDKKSFKFMKAFSRSLRV
ncbi:hypothetical protein E3N88_35466 [Mikania micrantha]|uniref:Uncharacterized protein n=1 Tax=Mikania micrantha TaxID=192012 RepID=A0A5N6M1Y4_9ASTR|nr:hypothetical protein E3N88_35466 [Mikania micrantha]